MSNSFESPVARLAVGGPDDDAWVHEVGAVAWAALADQLNAELARALAQLDQERARCRDLEASNAGLVAENAAATALSTSLSIEQAVLADENAALAAELEALRARVLPVTDFSQVVRDRELLAVVRQARVDQVAAQTRLACAGADLVSRAGAREEAAWSESPGVARVDVAQRRAAMQIALASGMSEYAVRRLTDLAAELPSRLPQVWTALVGSDSAESDSAAVDLTPGVGPVFDWDKAQAIFSQTLALQEDVAQRVAEKVLAKAPALVTAAKVRAYAEDVAAKADPVAHREVVAEAYAARTVSFRSAGAGMGAMTLTTDAVTIETVKAALEALAEHADTTVRADRATWDLRGVGARRADTLSDVILNAAGALEATCGPAPEVDGVDAADAGVAAGLDGAVTDADRGSSLSECYAKRGVFAASDLTQDVAPDQALPELPTLPPASDPVRSRIQARIQVLVPLSTLLGDDAPAELLGYGPIPAELARRIVADHAEQASWQCVYTGDPADGGHESVIGIGKSFHTSSYQPPPMLRAFLEVRDRTCVAPGCRQPAHRCDLDHAERFADGGPTCDCNLQTLCRHHHRIKHHGSGLPTVDLPTADPPPF